MQGSSVILAFFWLLYTKSFRYVLKTVYDSIQGCVVKIYPLT